MESNENFYSYYDYDQDQDASNDQNKDPGANQYDYAEGGSYDNYYGQQNEAGAIPTMTASTGAPKDPYEPEYEESKSEKLKKLQKNRFQSVMPGMEEINDGMRNMNIVDNSNQTMDMAQVPRDMYMGPSTMDPSSRGGIIPSSYGSSGSDSSLLKPKVFLNEESVRRGVMMQYRTDKMELPPSSTMPFSVSDQGICSPKLMRPTMYRIPNSSTLHQSSKIPMGLIVQPMADIGEGESEIPIAECGIEGPVRCTACGGYVNPGTQFLENCASARCNFCGSIFPVSDTKYGFANDPSSFPELSYGAYEFSVSGKYVYYEARNPVYVFILDVSNETFANTLFASTISCIQAALDSMPNPENTQICILTVDEYVHCYTLSDDLERGPTIHQISDKADPFLPVPFDNLMLNLSQDRGKIDHLLTKLLEIHTEEGSKFKPPAFNLSSAFLIAYELLEKTGGRILAFYSRIENVGPGINVVLDNHKGYNTDAEKNFFKANMGFYRDLAVKMFKKRITVDIFAGTYHNLNLPNPSQLCLKTGGDLYFYKNFCERFNYEKLHYEIFRILTRNGAYDCAFRVRCSEGYAPIAYIGNFGRVNSIDFELPSIDSDKTIGVVMRSEGKLNSDRFSAQAAMLYSTPDGDRKLRIINLILPVADKLSNVLRYVDQEALTHCFIKESLSFMGHKKVVEIKEFITHNLVKALSSENFSCCPLYVLGALKNPAFKLLGEIKVDEKYAWALKLLGCSTQRLLKLICPRVYYLSDIETNLVYGYPDEETGKIMKPLVCDNTYTNMSSSDLCIIDNGDFLYVYVGKALSSTLIYDIFGYEDWGTLHHYGVTNLDHPMDTDAYTRIINITEQIRSENDGAYQPIQVVLQDSVRFKELQTYALIEDSLNKNRDFTYASFVDHCNKLIRKL